MTPMPKQPKAPKFNFEKLKAEATSPDISIRVRSFKAYFEQFHEFPSYLFDNERTIDETLLQTIKALEKDSEISDAMKKALPLLLNRLPSLT